MPSMTLSFNFQDQSYTERTWYHRLRRLSRHSHNFSSFGFYLPTYMVNNLRTADSWQKTTDSHRKTNWARGGVDRGHVLLICSLSFSSALADAGTGDQTYWSLEASHWWFQQNSFNSRFLNSPRNGDGLAQSSLASCTRFILRIHFG